MLWARPAASSSGETIFEPEDSRARDFERCVVEDARLRAEAMAAILVLITIRQFLSSWIGSNDDIRVIGHGL
tara:strand:- start:304 stop:519 length:216 start_codon:yes stop_codon:yes gene_type:complete